MHDLCGRGVNDAVSVCAEYARAVGERHFDILLRYAEARGDKLVGDIRVIRANDKAEAVVRHLVERLLERGVLGVVKDEHRRHLGVYGYVENLASVALDLVLVGLERNLDIVMREQVPIAEQHALIVYSCGETEPVLIYHIAHGRQKLCRAADNAVKDICQRAAGLQDYCNRVEQNVVYAHGVKILHSVHFARGAVEEVCAGGDRLGAFYGGVVARYHSALRVELSVFKIEGNHQRELYGAG